MDTVTFAAERREIMVAADDDLRPLVEDAFDAYAAGQHDWADDLVLGASVLWSETYTSETGREPTDAELEDYQQRMLASLEQTAPVPGGAEDTNRVNTTTVWVSTYTVNDATSQAADPGASLQWITMHDESVRASHAAVDGQRAPAGGTFTVAGQELHFPGEPVGPPEAWINCRCVVARVGEDSEMTAQLSTDVALAAAADVDDAPAWDDDTDVEVAWHGVIAPTEIRSGDRRQFTANALRFRDLPVPLRFQKTDAGGHDGSVVVGNIERAWEEDGLIKAEGRFTLSPEADEAIGLVADQMLRGVSVDLDDATVELRNADGSAFADGDDPNGVVETIVDGRVASAALVSIPAFQEAFVALGTWDDVGQLSAAGDCAPCAARAELDGYAEANAAFAIAEGAWDGAASRFDDDQWKRSTIVDRGESYDTPKERYAVPIKEPNGDLSRAGVHAAAGRLNQVDAPASAIATARRKLVAAYSTLDEDPPDSLVAAAFAAQVSVGDAVSWTQTEADGEVEEHTGVVDSVDGDMAVVVDGDDTYEVPVADLQVHDGGSEEAFASLPGTHDGPGWVTNPEDTQRLRTYWTRGRGAAKIRWGAPGDFNRCRRQLAKYVPNPHYLAGTCANLHKVALGVWPGQEGGGRHAGQTITAAAWSVRGIDPSHVPPRAWFADPQLGGPTALEVTPEGKVFGHLALWDTCHVGLGLSIGDGEECVAVPRSGSGYAGFLNKSILTDDGVIAVGNITMGTGHAPGRLGAMPAAAHYDNTGSVAADVVCGEDAHGIWVSGSVRPGTDVQALRGSTLSGDWRTIGGAYEMVAALAVNVPGFAVPRLQISAAGVDRALVAAGVLAPRVPVAAALDHDAIARGVYTSLAKIKARADARAEVASRLRAARRAELVAVLPHGRE